MAVLMPAAAAVAQPHGDGREAAADQQVKQPRTIVSFKRIDPLRLACIEYVGPYWQIGPAISTVLEAMRDRGSDGPLYVRYLSHPLRENPRALRCRIGFEIAPQSAALPPPFELQQWPEEEVIAVTVNDRFVSPVHYYAILDETAMEKGYVPAGTVTELYIRPFSATAGGPTGSSLEIRAAVVPDASFPRLKNKQEASSATDSAPDQKGRPEPARSVRQMPSVSSGANAEREPGPSASKRSHPGGQTPSDINDAQSAARRFAEEAEQDTKPPARQDGKQDRGPGNLSPSRISFTEWVEQGRFDEAAALIVPDDRDHLLSLEPWLGQVLIRFRAIGRALHRADTVQGSAALHVSDAIHARYRQRKGPTAGYLLPPSPLEGSSADSVVPTEASHKRRIIRELDRLAAKLAINRIEPKEATALFFSCLDEVSQIVAQSSLQPPGKRK